MSAKLTKNLFKYILTHINTISRTYFNLETFSWWWALLCGSKRREEITTNAVFLPTIHLSLRDHEQLLWSSSPICEALPSPLLLFFWHMARVRIPFPYPKCYNVELVVILCPNLVIFSLHPSLANWLQLWSEYGPESLVWVIINKTLYMYLVDVLPMKWLLLVVIVA